MVLIACDKHDPILPGVRTAIFDTSNIDVKNKTEINSGEIIFREGDKILQNLITCEDKNEPNYKAHYENDNNNYLLEIKDKNGNIIKVWENIIEIIKATSYNKQNIYKCCQGKYKYAYGYKWCYL